MTNEQQALAEMPIWLVIALSLVGGVSGEMWRADTRMARGVGRYCGASHFGQVPASSAACQR
ncbi:hypothetical protein GGI52_004686 [Pseudomonas moraviensis]|uniref:Pyocin R2, holin n=1 Tax=Pseudomonas moraviensis TaxID=321662 RepID=A0A7Z0AWF5_9PSED|nr:hypothetical protein [Pseudomonas moraviensis]